MSKRESLIDCHDLMTQWDFIKNELNPAQLTAGSGKKAWWICDKGHSWEAMVKQRRKGSECPYCINRKAMAGFNDLRTSNPNLLNGWDFDKNELNPVQLTVGSEKKAWWICDRGHSWEARIKSRQKGSDCPYCANRMVLAGFNDLHTTHPDLADEWDYEKNDITPSQVTRGSRAAIWWLCSEGHSWQTTISSRLRGNGCTICSNRKVVAGINDLLTLNPALSKEWDHDKNVLLPSQVTPGAMKKAWWICTEGHSWEARVRDRNYGRGCPYCTSKKVLAGFNDLQTLRPELIDLWDASKNELAPAQVTFMSSKSVWWKCGKGHSWKAAVSDISKGGGCPYCAGSRALKGFNDLETINPKLALEWDHEKNDLSPSQVTIAAAKMVWWKCSKGHSWKTRITSRSSIGTGCPYCSGNKVLAGFNDLETTDKELAGEWDYEKNILKPSQVTRGSPKKVWWKCRRIDGHSWKATVLSRSIRGCDCPYCSRRLVLEGFNDLNTLFPHLSDEWDYEKNMLTPSQVMAGSRKSVWWKCRRNANHSWKATIGSRSTRGSNCPYCFGMFPYKSRCVY